MTASTIKTIIGRIQSAPFCSPIAVFKIPDDKSKLDAVFYSAIMTHRHIKFHKESYIGSFNMAMDLREVRHKLNKALLGD